MAKVLTDNQHYINIANKIREKTGTTAQYKPEEMPTGIEQVYGRGVIDGRSESGGSIEDIPVIQKQINGNPIVLTDVSEVPHHMWIQLSGEVPENAEIKVCGKNLVNLNTIMIGYQLYGGGVNGSVGVFARTDSAVIPCIRVKPNASYTFSLDNTDYWLNRICQMDENNLCTVHHSYYTNTSYDYAQYTIVTNEKTKWLTFQLQKKTGDKIAAAEDLANINLQWECNSSATTFEPYEETIYATNEFNFIEGVNSKLINMNISLNESFVINGNAIQLSPMDTLITVGYNQLYGVPIERARFWNSLQENGKRTDYNYAFTRYSNEMFTPQYDIVPKSFDTCFAYSTISNLKQLLLDANIQLDLSQATNVNNGFRQSYYLSHIPEVNLSSATRATYLFYYCAGLHTIDKVIVTDKITNYEGWLNYCDKLVNIQVEGTIAGKNLVLAQSKLLSKDSIKSIIMHLSQTTTGLSISLSQTAVNAAFETASGLKDGAESQEWAQLLEDYASNWTVTLA